MRNYSEAILKNEVSDFLLGKNHYLSAERDRYGLHDISSTFAAIEKYSDEAGNEIMAKRLIFDIKNLLGSTLTPLDFSMLTAYVFFYLRGYFEEGLFDAALDIDPEFNYLYEQKLAELEEKLHRNELPATNTGEYTHEYFLNNAKRFASLTEEKFGISLT